jgi:E3 ubiquitin-protein ligase RHA2
MASDTEKEATIGPKSSTIVVAIIVPSVLIIVLLTLIIMLVAAPSSNVSMSELTSSNRRRGFILPRMASYNYDDAIAREERMKRRQHVLERSVQTQPFYDWLVTEKEKHPESVQRTDTLW